LNSGQLALLHSTLKQLSIGMHVTNSKADLVHTDVVDNDTGIVTNGTGVDTNGSFPWTGRRRSASPGAAPSAITTPIS